MAWHTTGDKPSYEPMVAQFSYTYICHRPQKVNIREPIIFRYNNMRQAFCPAHSPVTSTSMHSPVLLGFCSQIWDFNFE